jgi:hypothetical protein
MTVRRKSQSAVALLPVLGLAAALGGCSAASTVETAFDTNLPAGTPARPLMAPQFPAVHDMPPPRREGTLSEDEQERLERELMAVRDGQEGRNPPAAAKKKPNPATANQPAGASRNP